MSKNVLIIAGEFPPLKTIGRIRTAKFAAHLLNLGWTPIVITLAYDKNDPLYDEELDSEIANGVTVYRVKNDTLDALIINFVKKVIRRSPGSGRNAKTATQQSSGKTTEIKRPESSGFFESLQIRFLKFINDWLHIPDNYLVWASRAEKLATRLIKEHEIDVIYTTLPPFSACKVGYKLKLRTGLPWVVDFRDLWTGDVLREWIPPLRQKLELRMERRYLDKADSIVTVSQQKTEYLQELHCGFDNKIWATITNGYDLESFDYLLSRPRIKSDTIDLVYTGRLFKNRQGYTLPRALGELARNRIDATEKLRFHYYGGVAPEIQQRYNELIEQYGLQDCFIFHGDVDFESSKLAQVNADYLLLIVDTGATADGVIPGKLFEYVASERPIFALCNAAATNEIIQKANIGKVMAVEDVQACYSALEEILDDPDYGELAEVNKRYLSQFDRKTLTEKLANLLDQLTDKATDQA
jgi:glycosyltransferase involved in cell wall biosynthesis